MSLPSRERGLKCLDTVRIGQYIIVAPLAGAWIEIWNSLSETERFTPSLPSRERGLKSELTGTPKQIAWVAPLAGAWIEIVMIDNEFPIGDRRSPRGSVD